jgi:hypothetical protein
MLLLLILGLSLCLELGLRSRCWCRSPIVPDWCRLATHVNHGVVHQARADGRRVCREAVHGHWLSSMSTVHCCWCARSPGWELAGFLIITHLVLAHRWHGGNRRDVWYIPSHFKDGCLRLTEHWLRFCVVKYRGLMGYTLSLFIGRAHRLFERIALSWARCRIEIRKANSVLLRVLFVIWVAIALWVEVDVVYFFV